MGEKYEHVRVSGLISLPEGEVRNVHEEAQLDRIERKLDKLLSLLEDKELAVRFDKGTISAESINVISNSL